MRGSAVASLLRLWVRFPPEDMYVCLLWVLFVFSYRSLWRADHSSRGVLPTVVLCCVWSRDLVNEAAMDHFGGGVAIAYKKQTNKCKPLSSKAGSRCSRFKHSQMTHFITRFSTFRVRFRRIGMRGRDCRVESPHCSIITQLIISSVSHYMKSKDFVLNRTIKFYNLLTYFILPKKFPFH